MCDERVIKMGNVERYRPQKNPRAAQQDSIFGPPPLGEGDDEPAYAELLRRVTDRIRPKDVLEEILVRDFVDLTWERFRWRRDKVAILPQAFSSYPTNPDFERPDFFDMVERIEHLIWLGGRRSTEVLRELEYYRLDLAQILEARRPAAMIDAALGSSEAQ
jgi:hypothetical protein